MDGFRQVADLLIHGLATCCFRGVSSVCFCIWLCVLRATAETELETTGAFLQADVAQFKYRQQAVVSSKWLHVFARPCLDPFPESLGSFFDSPLDGHLGYTSKMRAGPC